VSEYELCDSELAVTIVRAVGQISRTDHPYRKVGAGPEIPTPDAQCLGPQEFRFAVLPHDGDWIDGEVLEQAERYHHPLVAGRVSGAATGTNDDVQEAGGLEIEGVGVALSALRRRGLWLELRLACLRPNPVTATVSLPGLMSARTADVLGRPGKEIHVTDGSFSLALGPWEIRTVQLRRQLAM
jgi:alpha-mannosidase